MTTWCAIQTLIFIEVGINLQAPFFLFSINMESVYLAIYNPDASGSSQISILAMISKLFS